MCIRFRNEVEKFTRLNLFVRSFDSFLSGVYAIHLFLFFFLFCFRVIGVLFGLFRYSGSAKCQSSETWFDFPLNGKQSTQMLYIRQIEKVEWIKVLRFCPHFSSFAFFNFWCFDKFRCWICNSKWRSASCNNFQMNTHWMEMYNLIHNLLRPFRSFRFSITIVSFLFFSFDFDFETKVSETTPNQKHVNCSFQREIV